MPVPAFPSASEAKHEEGFLHSADHLRLYWQRYTPPSARATVAVLHGGGDHSGRYPGLTAALVRAGFEAALVDFRGHGQSDGRRWHVDSFSDYLADLDAFLAKLRADGPRGGKLFLAGHSQGSLIAVSWALARGRDVAGYVLSSPYLRLAMKPSVVKVAGARLMGRVIPWLPVSTGMDLKDLTSDVELQRWTERDPLFGRATTPRWFDESTRAQEEVLRRPADFTAPVLVLAAGADRIADPTATERWFEALGSQDKQLRVYAGFRHEIYNEVERERPLGEAVAWLLARAP
ncbi:MAG TPA: lysophospholipase [Anaeromyxobacteraceae bacterium]|nr:lysophospholipase [Anaeromyxobacteraceae bacterium]